MYSSNLYKTSHDQIKTLHEILQFTICLIFLSVSMTYKKENQDRQNEFGRSGS